MRITNETNDKIIHIRGRENRSFTKRIGSTTYRVGIHFNQPGEETLDEKILRLAKNDLNPATENAILTLPQTDRLPEGSAS